MTMGFVACMHGAFRVAISDKTLMIEVRAERTGSLLTPDQARRLALELQAAAEEIDPQPPPRPDRGPRRKSRNTG